MILYTEEQKEVMTADQAFEYKRQVENIKEFQDQLHQLSVVSLMKLEIGLFKDDSGTLKDMSTMMHKLSHGIANVLDGEDPEKALKEVFDIKKMG